MCSIRAHHNHLCHPRSLTEIRENHNHPRHLRSSKTLLPVKVHHINLLPHFRRKKKTNVLFIFNGIADKRG